MERLHVLVAIAAVLVALRGGLNLLKLYGVRPASPASHSQQQQQQQQHQQQQPPHHVTLQQCQLQGFSPMPPFKHPSGSPTHLQQQQQQQQELLEWLQSKGAVVDHAQVADFDGLRGLQATRDFSRHDVILEMPTALTISISTFSAARAAAGSRRLQKLLQLPDGDMYLDVVALLHEALLFAHYQQQQEQQQENNSTSASGSGSSSDGNGDGSGSDSDSGSGDGDGSGDGSGEHQDDAEAPAPGEGWGKYLLSLPPHVELPLFASSGSSSNNNNSSRSSQQLTSALPHLNRLISKRLQGLITVWPRVQQLLRALLEPYAATSALDQLEPCDAWRAFLWAYSMAQTRVVALEVEDAPKEVREKLRQHGIKDIGVMVPLMDMANHGSGNQVNARVMGDGVTFRLVATQHIQEGDQVFISYNPQDDEAPVCSWRWLVEFGFVPGPVTTTTTTSSGTSSSSNEQGPDAPAAAPDDTAAADEETSGVPTAGQAAVSSDSSSSSSSDGVASTSTIIHSQDPRRWCFAMNFTLDLLLDSCEFPEEEMETSRLQPATNGDAGHLVDTPTEPPTENPTEPPTEHSTELPTEHSSELPTEKPERAYVAELHRKLRAVGLDDTSFWIELDGSGRLPEGLVEWLGYVYSFVAASHYEQQQLKQQQRQQQQSDEVATAGCAAEPAAAAAADADDVVAPATGCPQQQQQQPEQKQSQQQGMGDAAQALDGSATGAGDLDIEAGELCTGCSYCEEILDLIEDTDSDENTNGQQQQVGQGSNDATAANNADDVGASTPESAPGPAADDAVVEAGQTQGSSPEGDATSIEDAFEQCIALCVLKKVLLKQRDSIRQAMQMQQQQGVYAAAPQPGSSSGSSNSSSCSGSSPVCGDGGVDPAACPPEQLHQLLRLAWEAHQALQITLDRLPSSLQVGSKYIINLI